MLSNLAKYQYHQKLKLVFFTPGNIDDLLGVSIM